MEHNTDIPEKKSLRITHTSNVLVFLFSEYSARGSSIFSLCLMKE